MPEGLVRTTGGRFVRAPLIVVNPDLVEGPGDIGRPRVRRDNPADRQEVPGTGDTFVYQYRVPEDVKLQPIDVEGNIDQRIGGLMLERMKRENALDDLLAQGHLMDPQARLARRHMLTLGLRILELDRLYGPNAVLAYVLTYLTARELKMVIEKYDDPLSPGSVSLLPSVIDILQGGFRALTHMTWDEADDTRLEPEAPLPSWWNKWDHRLLYQHNFIMVRWLVMRIPNTDPPQPWSFRLTYEIPSLNESSSQVTET